MPRKKKQDKEEARPAPGAGGAKDEASEGPEAAEPQAGGAATEAQGPMVEIVRTAQASKLSPRGDGLLTYQAGRLDGAALLRISGNESSGRFSTEWVAAEAIRAALARAPKSAKSFKAAVLLRAAWRGRSSCNGGFGAAALVAEGVLEPDPDKKGMLRLTSPGALEDWERSVLEAEAKEPPELAPLHPPKPKPFPRKAKPAGEAANEAGEGDAAAGGAPEGNAAGGDDGEAA